MSAVTAAMDGGLLLLLLLLLLALTVSTAAADVTETRLRCLVSYLEGEGRRTVDIYNDHALNGNSHLGPAKEIHWMALLPAEPTSNF